MVFTYETMINPKIAVRGRAGHDRVKTFVALDDHTIKATLGEPFAPYLVVWQKTSVIPQHLLAAIPDMNTAAFNTQPVGTGPFRFKERVAGDHIEFEGYPDYHGDGPHLKTLIQKYVPDQQVLFAQFQTGQVSILDLQGLPPELLPRARQLPNKTVEPVPTAFVEFIYFNCGKPQFSDKRVRQALYLAMDKKSLIEKLYFGIPPRTLSYLSPSHWAYNAALKDPGYDPAKAAAMLDEAGWKVGSSGTREKDGIKMAFTISTTAGNKSRERSQQFLQQNLKAINVDMSINNMPASVVWGEYTVKSQFDTLQVAWDPLLYPDPDYSARIMSDQIPAKGGSGANYVPVSEQGDRRPLPSRRGGDRPAEAQGNLRTHPGDPARRPAVRAAVRSPAHRGNGQERQELQAERLYGDQHLELQRMGDRLRTCLETHDPDAEEVRQDRLEARLTLAVPSASSGQALRLDRFAAGSG